jgi:hypothetical protein
MTDYLYYGFLIRSVITGIIFYLPINIQLKIMMIFLTDSLDCSNLFNKLYKTYDPSCNCDDLCKTYKYQSIDKAVDLFTYFLVYLYLGLPSLYMYIIFIRLVGITMFYYTLKSDWLIICPDLFKEVLLYSWFIADINPVNLTYIYVLKTIFEFIWHKYHNNTRYDEQ